MLDAATQQTRVKGLYIGGSWVVTDQQFDDNNPSDRSVWAHIPDAGAEETRRSVSAAHAAFAEWSGLPFQERAGFMLRIAEIWERNSSRFVSAAQFEGGGWHGKGVFEAGFVSEIFRAAAALYYGSIGEVLPSHHGKFSTAVRGPLGVIGVVSPWNVPGTLSARGIAFPMAAGNTIVLKPSEDTPYAGGLLFAETLEEAGVPPGVFNVFTCSRQRVAEVGDELIDNPLVKGISFTGSTAVGRRIAAKCGAHLKKCCVELGGKDSLIVLEDADMDRATSAASFGAFMHQGQICMSVEKVLVQESVYPEFLRRFVDRAGKIRTGILADSANVNGPLINDRQAERVKAQIKDAVDRGAKVALGGGVNGRFVEPKILTHVNRNMDDWREESFGPVAAVVPYGSSNLCSWCFHP